MGQSVCLSSQQNKITTKNRTESITKPQTTKLKILVDSWFPNSIDLTNNSHKVSSIYFLRGDQNKDMSVHSTLTLNAEGINQLRKNIIEKTSKLQNSVKITVDQSDCFIIDSLDSKMHFWKFAKNWCRFKKDDPIIINGAQYQLKKLINDQHELGIQIEQLKKYSSTDKQKGKISPCKICFESAFDQNNLLMSPCKCTGSMANVHVKCLASWILQDKESHHNIFSAHLKKQKCQICHSNYLQSKAFQEILHHVIFQKEGLEIPYALFEGTAIKQNKIYLSVLVISFTEKQIFKIGKDFTEQSQKDYNCQIKYENGQIFVKDNQITPGTGVLTTLPIKINQQQLHHTYMINNNMLINFQILNNKGNTTNQSLSTQSNMKFEETSQILMTQN